MDETSALWGKSAENLTGCQAEFLILIKGFDDTFFQTVHVRYSYRFEELVWCAFRARLSGGLARRHGARTRAPERVASAGRN